MTYKAIVKRMVENEATNWIEKLLEGNGIKYGFVSAKDTTFEHDKDLNMFMFETEIKVYTGGIIDTYLTVGGTVDDSCGICTSVIWNNNHKTIWMNTEEARKALSIEKFEI